MLKVIMRPTLGIDIGRVIIHGDGPDTSFVGPRAGVASAASGRARRWVAGSDEEAMRAPAMDGAFDAIARLVRRFSGRVWLVSKCGKKVEMRSRMWLAQHRLHEITGVRERPLIDQISRKDAGTDATSHTPFSDT